MARKIIKCYFVNKWSKERESKTKTFFSDLDYLAYLRKNIIQGEQYVIMWREAPPKERILTDDELRRRARIWANKFRNNTNINQFINQ